MATAGRYIIFILCFLFCGNYCNARYTGSGFGMTTGYRFNNGSIYLEHCFKKVVVQGECVLNKYQDAGYSLGANYIAYYSKLLEVDAGICFTHTGGITIPFLWHENGTERTTTFDISGGQYCIPYLVVRKNLFGLMERETYTRQGKLSIFIRMGYRFTLGKSAEAIYVSGTPYPDKQRELNRAISGGLGGSVGFSFSIKTGKKNRITRSTRA